LHCSDLRHKGEEDLKVETVAKILHSAKKYKFDSLALTGGEPTMHPEFTEILAMICEADYRFGLVSNGWNFHRIYGEILPHRHRLSGITFSLDGAKEETHDSIRVNGSYRKVMQAISVCMIEGIPFTFNTVITAKNLCELEEMAELSAQLGSRGLRFGHLILTPQNANANLVLSPEECKEVEVIIRKLQRNHRVPIVMAPGYHTFRLFPCAPLQMEEFNVDYHGNITMCCHLSGQASSTGNMDAVGNLEKMSFSDAHRYLIANTIGFRQKKRELLSNYGFSDTDYFPCWYCSNYFKKLAWLKEYPKNPWSPNVWTKDNNSKEQNT
jgi:MoaA/NifB/PqqE/SkfB family radical SAM enzyme